MLYHFTKAGALALGMEILEDQTDVVNDCANNELLSIRTTYETRWISEGKKITYLKMKLDHALFQKENFEKANAEIQEWLTIHNAPKAP